MKKFFTLAAAVLASMAMIAQEFTFTGSSLPEGWTATSAGSTNFNGESDKVLKIANGGTITYTFAEATDLESIDFVFSFGSKNAGMSVTLTAKDAEGNDLGTATLEQKEQQTGSNVRQEANVAFKFNGVKTFVIENKTEKNFLLGYVSFNAPKPTDVAVAKVTITGENTCAVGEKVMLKATTDAAATAIWWTAKDSETKLSETATFEFEASAVGDFTFVAYAQNDLNTEPASAEFTITVKKAPNVVLEGVVIALADQVKDGDNYTYTVVGGGEHAVKNKNVYVELPAGDIHGEISFIGSSDKADRFLYIYGQGGTVEDKDRAIVMTISGAEIEYTKEDIYAVNDTYYLYFKTSSDFKFKSLSYSALTGEVVHTPSLKASVEKVTLAVTPSEANPATVVTFTGKYLTPGTYDLTIDPAVEGLTVTPASVTVAEDGKLNAEVTIAYASEVEVEAAKATVALAIETVVASVEVNYSATAEKTFISASLNIEQLILDNGTKYDIKGALTAAGWEHESINGLDSLNDEKDARNEPYLGLKLKSVEGAYLAGWLKAADVLLVKFGNLGSKDAEGINVFINGEENNLTHDQLVESGRILSLAFESDTYVKIVVPSTNTFVFKQLMLNEDIQEVTLPKSPVIPEGLEDIDASVKAVKIMHDGQLLIKKGDLFYNAQGAIVK